MQKVYTYISQDGYRKIEVIKRRPGSEFVVSNRQQAVSPPQKKSSFFPIFLVTSVLGLIIFFGGTDFGNKVWRKLTASLNLIPFSTNEAPAQKAGIKKADIQNQSWQLTLINHEHPFPSNFKIKTMDLANGEKVDERIYPELQRMFNDMRAIGIYPQVVSGYRTTQEQKEIMAQKIQEYVTQGDSRSTAKIKAESLVLAPGYSEHHSGLAIDINADGINSTGTQVYNWLQINAARYGFIKRYPADKTHLTGINDEPWHYRYVGVKAAQEMVKNNWCLEEYLIRNQK